MNNFKIVLVALVLLISMISVSCGKLGGCDEDCFTPPQPISFRVMNDSTDLIYTGYFNEDSISLYYMDGETQIETDISIYNDTVLEYSRIHSNVISWKSVEGYNDFYLRLNSLNIEEVYLVVELITEDCCTFHPITSIEINSDPPSFDTPSYSFIIQKEIN